MLPFIIEQGHSTPEMRATCCAVPRSVDEARAVALGALIWWPANILGDGLPLMIPGHGPKFAALVTGAMVAGNIIVLMPLHRWHPSSVLQAAIGLGAVAQVTAVEWWVTASFMAGVAGAAGSVVVWPLVAAQPNTITVSIAVGMASGAVLSSGLMLVMPTAQIYVAASIGVFALLLVIVQPFVEQLSHVIFNSAAEVTLPLVYDDADTDDSNDEAPPLQLPAPPPARPPYQHLLCCMMLYVTGYAIPGLLPMSATGTGYRMAIASGTAGDILGRLVVSRMQPMAAVAFGLYGVCVLARPVASGQWTMIVFIGALYLLRASAIVQIQLQLKAIPGGTRHVGRAAQIGSVIGACSAALIVWC